LWENAVKNYRLKLTGDGMAMSHREMGYGLGRVISNHDRDLPRVF
jgi:hypothetical protein